MDAYVSMSVSMAMSTQSAFCFILVFIWFFFSSIYSSVPSAIISAEQGETWRKNPRKLMCWNSSKIFKYIGVSND